MAAREREQRQRLRDLAIFERINGNVARTSATLAVKKVSYHAQTVSSRVLLLQSGTTVKRSILVWVLT